MSAHTKGPWEAISNLVRTPFAHGDAELRGELIAECSSKEHANLIAAAPELLEQLQAMTDAYAAVMKDAGLSHYPEALAVVRHARAAIAKATGSAS